MIQIYQKINHSLLQGNNKLFSAFTVGNLLQYHKIGP